MRWKGGAEFLVESLARDHRREGFTCGTDSLDGHLQQGASQDAKRGLASVFVLVLDASPEVLGYYSLSAYSVQLVDLPADVQGRLPRYPSVPATLLGRLAIATRVQGQKLGEHLLMDALRRAGGAATEVASFAVVVDAIDDNAAAFYRQYEFRPMADNARKLFLPMSTIKALGL